MAKKNFKKGIDNIFSSTSPSPSPLNPPKGDFEGVEEVKEIKEASPVRNEDEGAAPSETRPSPLNPPKGEFEEQPKAAPKTGENVLAAYNVRYPKELQKRIKRYCIEHDVDMKDVFIEGAVMYMDRNK